jgi:hypothetical protein
MIKNKVQNQDELGRILDSCLNLISSGAATVDSIMEQYPEYREQLKPPLEAALWLQSRKEVFNPRPGFVRLSQRRLVNRFREQNSEAGVVETLSRIPAFFQERRIAVQYSALLTLTAVLLFVGFRSAGLLVQRSIPGDPLYATKITQEEMRVNLTSNEEVRTRLRIEFAQRRVIELQELVLVGRTDLIDKTLKNFEFQMDQAASGILALAKIDEIKAAQLSSLFEETLRVPVNNFVGIVDSNPVLVSGEFIDKFLTLASEPFESRPFEFVMVEATVTPTLTSTATLTSTPTNTPRPTYTSTATFTSTATAPPEATPTDEKQESQPAAVTPTPTVKSVQEKEPTATAVNTPTIAPTPTKPATATQAPPPSDDTTPEPTPEKTKKPKPTQHPTYWPSEGN